MAFSESLSNARLGAVHRGTSGGAATRMRATPEPGRSDLALAVPLPRGSRRRAVVGWIQREALVGGPPGSHTQLDASRSITGISDQRAQGQIELALGLRSTATDLSNDHVHPRGALAYRHDDGRLNRCGSLRKSRSEGLAAMTRVGRLGPRARRAARAKAALLAPRSSCRFMTRRSVPRVPPGRPASPRRIHAPARGG